MPAFDNIVALANSSIGDCLMWLDFFERCHDGNPECRCFFIGLKERPLLKEAARRYSYVRFLSPDDGWGSFLSQLVRICLRKSAIIIPFSFGGVLRKVVLAARALSLRPGSKVITFNDVPGAMLMPFDCGQRYYRNLLTILAYMDQVPEERRPRFLHQDMPLPTWAREPYVAVHPFAGNPMRSLPPARWRNLLDFLRRAFPELSVIVTGAPGDRACAESIIGPRSEVINAAGCLSFHELASLLARARMFVGCDSGISHLASLLSIRSVIVGNRSNPTWWPTCEDAIVLTNPANCLCQGDKRGACRREVDGQVYFRCMIEVSDEEIGQALARALGPQTGPSLR